MKLTLFLQMFNLTNIEKARSKLKITSITQLAALLSGISGVNYVS